MEFMDARWEARDGEMEDGEMGVLSRILEAQVVGVESFVHILSFKAIVFPEIGDKVGQVPVVGVVGVVA
jgi:hypothetical protein